MLIKENIWLLVWKFFPLLSAEPGILSRSAEFAHFRGISIFLLNLVLTLQICHILVGFRQP